MGRGGRGGGRQKVNCETAIRHLRLNKLPAGGAAMARVRVTQLAQQKKKAKAKMTSGTAATTTTTSRAGANVCK